MRAEMEDYRFEDPNVWVIMSKSELFQAKVLLQSDIFRTEN